MPLPWLKKLKKVKEELKSERWPRSAKESFSIGILLMAHALEDLRSDIIKKMPEASDGQIQLEMRRRLIHFNKIDSRWVKRYKQDYAKFKPG